ncbi:MAG: class I SAM-dependent methyltransferase [Candidatus Methanofastidiosia archaeon]|jgi:2-polyprenyl-3-methyl-5-hydroxy-6-metoxy-1,4-benzoquinol methylase
MKKNAKPSLKCTGNPMMELREYPKEIYDVFLRVITKDGKILDLGCGNGLLLKHIMENSGCHMVPYGVDFIKESIHQAKTIIHPENAENFHSVNIVEFTFPDAPYDYILFDPFDIHESDLRNIINKAIKALSDTGFLIFYTYTDVLDFFEYEWVGEFFLWEIKKVLKRIDHDEVSIGVYSKNGI